MQDSIYTYNYDSAPNNINDQVAARWQALERALKHSEQSNYRFEIVPYRFSQQAADLLRDSCILPTTFEGCDNTALQESITRRVMTLDGSAIQHCLQQELMSILERTAQARYAQIQNQSMKLFTDTVGAMTHVATEYNQTGDVRKTMLLADFCWAVLDVSMGIGEGMIDGVSSVAHMIAHPLDTVTNTAHGVATAAHCTDKVLYEICGITKDCLVDFDVGMDRVNRAYANIAAIAKQLNTKLTDITLRQKVRAVTGVC